MQIILIRKMVTMIKIVEVIIMTSCESDIDNCSEVMNNTSKGNKEMVIIIKVVVVKILT